MSAVSRHKDREIKAVRPAPVPWEWQRKALPPHDVELFAADGQVIARWSGTLLDEIGTRKRAEEDFARIARAVNDLHYLRGGQHYRRSAPGAEPERGKLEK